MKATETIERILREVPMGSGHIQALDQARIDVERMERVIEHLQAERASRQLQVEQLVRILAGIHALCAPADITMPDGEVRRFVPPDAERYWRRLSDRIKAIEDEVRVVFDQATHQAVGQTLARR